ncbi:hypothetical protein PTKIN_Ptkin14bG0197100 [Pterospermum kingtungense]
MKLPLLHHLHQSGKTNLFELVESLLLLPLKKQSLAQQCNDKQALGCGGVSKDALFQAKEDTQQLQSILRRRGDDAGFINEAKDYLASRKKAKKLINKSLRVLKSKYGFAHLENDVEATFRMLRDVEVVTFTLFESLMSFISGTKMQPNHPTGVTTMWPLRAVQKQGSSLPQGLLLHKK